MNKEDEEVVAALEDIVNASERFNELVKDNPVRPPISEIATKAAAAAKERLDDLICRHVGLGGLTELQHALEVIAPPIEQEDRAHLIAAPFKSRDAGDAIIEDAIYWVLNAAVGIFSLIKQNKFEGNALMAAHEAFRVHLNEIIQLPEKPEDDPAGWGKVIVEVIWHRKAEERFHVQRTDLEPAGKIYALIIAEAEAACKIRKGKRDATFQKKAGMDHLAFLSLDDSARLKAIEDRSKTPEERDKSALRATRLLEDARVIEAIAVSDLELREALRDRLVERLRRASR